jgi:hypothetical protein
MSLVRIRDKIWISVYFYKKNGRAFYPFHPHPATMPRLFIIRFIVNSEKRAITELDIHE